MSIGDYPDLQLAVWGYAVTGEVTNFNALVAETRPSDDWWDQPWDRTRADLAMTVLYDGGRRLGAPDFFALRWLPNELRMQAITDMHATRDERRGIL